MIRLDLPYPPTANNLFLNTGRGRARTKGYDFWIALSRAEIMRQRPGSIMGPYHLKLTAERPDNRARDIDNLIKPTSDLLKKAGVISDDSKALSILAEWDLAHPSKAAVVHVSLWAPQ